MHSDGIEYLDLNPLKIFDVVMTESALTCATSALAITQHTVSNAIERLLKSFQDKILFEQGRTFESTQRATDWCKAVRRSLLKNLDVALQLKSFDSLTSVHAPYARLYLAPLIRWASLKLLSGTYYADLVIGYVRAVTADFRASAQSDQCADNYTAQHLLLTFSEKNFDFVAAALERLECSRVVKVKITVNQFSTAG